MPTIDELPSAVSVSDTDEFVVSQSDVARSATRAQVLAGVQAALAVPTNSLLGRMSAGVGSPETIGIGANLSISAGALNAPAPFTISQLEQGGAPGVSDLVPIAQGGQNASLPYAAFLAGISNVAGIDSSDFTAEPAGGTTVRAVADLFSDALSVESFGAVGDGNTDDTAAFVAALASGRILRLDGRVYVVNGPLLVQSATAIIGVPGATVLTRSQITSASEWIVVNASSISVFGVQFDAAGLVGGDMPAVLVNGSCSSADFSACAFRNAKGATAGSGLTCITTSATCVRALSCAFNGNSLHGMYVSGNGGAALLNSVLERNGACGLRAEAGVSAVARENYLSANGIGLSVGNWSSGIAPTQGTGPYLAGNSCTLNSQWGIAASGYGASIMDNVLTANGNANAGGGILGRLAYSRLCANVVSEGLYGVDGRGCVGCLIEGNHVSNAGTAFAVGGSQNLTVRTNAMLNNLWGVAVSAIEPLLSYALTGPLTIAENWISFSGAQGGGITVTDAAQGIALTGNDINGNGSATIDQAIWLHTDEAIVRGNRWNNQARFKVNGGQVAGLESLVVPDTADEVLVISAPAEVQSILTAHQADTLGQIAFVRVNQGGEGYTEAQVAITGSGTGAAASAIVNEGQVVWIILTNPGSGFGPIGSAASVTITGDGSGAIATAFVGIPVTEGRQLRLNCNTQVQLALGGAAPPQQSWTGYASTVPAYGSVDLEGTFGAWRAVSFPPVDYLTPTGDGGAIVRSVGNGNLTLQPSSGGALHLASASEAVGCTSTIGRGSPLGAISAPPGSDYRNLNGGAGNTFWVKQQNNDATGWAAIG